MIHAPMCDEEQRDDRLLLGNPMDSHCALWSIQPPGFLRLFDNNFTGPIPSEVLSLGSLGEDNVAGFCRLSCVFVVCL